jgi:translation initiation factor 4A
MSATPHSHAHAASGAAQDGASTAGRGAGPVEYESFDAMPLHARVLRGVYSTGFERPSPIQRVAIGAMIGGGDVVAQAQSGTGKTGAFSIGLLQRLDARRRETQALVLSPTRELAEQTAEVMNNLGAYMLDGTAPRGAPMHLCSLFVGRTNRQLDMRTLSAGVLVAVGTPGRVGDLINRGALQVGGLRTIVLDEADEMLSQGFAQQVHDIFRFVPKDVQIGLFSATMPPEVLELCGKLLRAPTKILVPVEQQTLEGLKQFHVALDEETKLLALMDLYESVSIAQSVVFANTRRKVEWIAAQMSAHHHTVACIHSGMELQERADAMKGFRRGNSRVLVTTDLIARGIDVQHVNYVINYDVPASTENYLHRIGRSARFGRRGIAINFVASHEVAALREIEEHYAITIPELPDDFARYLDDVAAP